MLIAEKRDKLANICYLHMKHKHKKFTKSTFNDSMKQSDSLSNESLYIVINFMLVNLV